MDGANSEFTAMKDFITSDKPPLYLQVVKLSSSATQDEQPIDVSRGNANFKRLVDDQSNNQLEFIDNQLQPAYMGHINELLKSSGMEVESRHSYFEAILNFEHLLHVAYNRKGLTSAWRKTGIMPFGVADFLKNFPGYNDINDDDLKCIHDRFHLLVKVATAKGRVHPDFVGEIIGWNLIDRSKESISESSQLQLVENEIKETAIFERGPSNQGTATILTHQHVQKLLKEGELKKLNERRIKIQKEVEKENALAAEKVKAKNLAEAMYERFCSDYQKEEHATPNAPWKSPKVPELRSILKYFKPDLNVVHNLKRDECIQQLQIHMIAMKNNEKSEEIVRNPEESMEIENS